MLDLLLAATSAVLELHGKMQLRTARGVPAPPQPMRTSLIDLWGAGRRQQFSGQPWLPHNRSCPASAFRQWRGSHEHAQVIYCALFVFKVGVFAESTIIDEVVSAPTSALCWCQLACLVVPELLSQSIALNADRSLRALEEELRPSADYMLAHGSESQYNYIDADMRQRTVSWLVEVSCESRLHQETLFLAINLLDRFLSATSVSPQHTVNSTKMRRKSLAMFSKMVLWLFECIWLFPKYGCMA